MLYDCPPPTTAPAAATGVWAAEITTTRAPCAINRVCAMGRINCEAVSSVRQVKKMAINVNESPIVGLFSEQH